MLFSPWENQVKCHVILQSRLKICVILQNVSEQRHLPLDGLMGSDGMIESSEGEGVVVVVGRVSDLAIRLCSCS